MNKCLYCGKEVKNKYCNTTCQNKHLNPSNANKRYGKLKLFIVECEKCKEEFTVKEREKLFPKKEKYYCSRSCANSRNWSNEDKKKKSNTLINKTKLYKKLTLKKKCKNCNKLFEYPYTSKNRSFCSNSCSAIWQNLNTDRSHKGGLKSANVQSKNRRSKNEIYFAKLCKKHFNNVKTNEPIFNGWDADVIIEDIKYAILWNGRWHYEKITEKHSVKQVQNRDRIKIKEIKEMNYTPYIIKDMGKHNKEFVEEKFNEFINHLD